MTHRQIESLLKAMNIEDFVAFYNENIVESSGDFCFSTIHQNDTYEMVSQLSRMGLGMEAVIEMAQGSIYSECDDYCIIREVIESFSTVEEFLETDAGEDCVETILADEAEYLPIIVGYIK